MMTALARSAIAPPMRRRRRQRGGGGAALAVARGRGAVHWVNCPARPVGGSGSDGATGGGSMANATDSSMVSRGDGPLYAQIAAAIEARYRRRELRARLPFPARAGLGGLPRCQPADVRQALTVLEGRGLIDRVVGRHGGTFVRKWTVDRDLTSVCGLLRAVAPARASRRRAGAERAEDRGLAAESPRGSTVAEGAPCSKCSGCAWRVARRCCSSRSSLPGGGLPRAAGRAARAVPLRPARRPLRAPADPCP